MKNTMKKGILLLALVAIVAGGVFAQRGGDTWQVGDETWVVQSVSGDTMTMKKAPGLAGVWDKTDGFGPPTVTVSGANAVLIAPLTFAEVRNVSGSWAPRYNEAVSRGMINVGDTFLRNIQSTGTDSRGRTTWSCESLYLTGSGNNARLEWRRGTITMQANGETEFPGWGIYRKR